MTNIERYRRRAGKAVLFAVTLSVASLSMAQPRGDDDHRDDRRGGSPSAQHGGQPMAQHGGAPFRGGDHGGDRGGYHGGYHGGDRGEGAGPDHEFRQGGRLPAEYRNRQYVVDDWRGHHLSAPPRGYHWVQTGSDYVLAAIATGIIANILINH